MLVRRAVERHGVPTLRSTLNLPVRIGWWRYPPQPALLERERELAELEALLAEARAGTGRLLLVEGVAGLGKTRLLRETRRRADGSGMRVLAARATELERDFPFGVVRQLFEPPLADADQVVRAGLFDGPAAAARPLLEPELSSEPEWADGGQRRSVLRHPSWPLLVCGEPRGVTAPLLSPSMMRIGRTALPCGFLAFLLPRLEDLPVLLLLALRPRSRTPREGWRDCGQIQSVDVGPQLR